MFSIPEEIKVSTVKSSVKLQYIEASNNKVTIYWNSKGALLFYMIAVWESDTS